MSHFTISRPSRRRAAQLCGLALVAATALALTAPLPSSRASGPPGGSEGVICEPSDGNTFNLDATAGYVATPDGNSIYLWSYTASGRGSSFPARRSAWTPATG